MTDELDPFTAAKSYLIRALSKRMLSEAELRQRLKRREHTQKTIDAALDWARDLRLIDDAAVSEAIAREAQRTCRGPRWIREKSRKRGVEAFLETSQANDELLERALRYLRPRYQQPDTDDRVEKQRHYRRWLARLARRGFSGSIAQEALSLVAKEGRPT
jgi:SOS response regulatory protein OraA/RecX